MVFSDFGSLTRHSNREIATPLNRNSVNYNDLDSILEHVINDGLYEESTEYHHVIVNSVIALTGQEHNQKHLSTTLRSYLSKLGGYEPQPFTLGSFLFGSLMSSYPTNNKYCSAMAAFSVPDYYDSIQVCNGNVIWMTNSGVTAVVDNKKRVCFVELDSAFLGESLNADQIVELEKLGCKKFLLRKEARMIDTVKISNTQTNMTKGDTTAFADVRGASAGSADVAARFEAAENEEDRDCTSFAGLSSSQQAACPGKPVVVQSGFGNPFGNFGSNCFGDNINWVWFLLGFFLLLLLIWFFAYRG